MNSIVSLNVPSSNGVPSGPKMTAFQTIMLFSDGAPLTPAGGSSCNLLKSLMRRRRAGVDMALAGSAVGHIPGSAVPEEAEEAGEAEEAPRGTALPLRSRGSESAQTSWSGSTCSSVASRTHCGSWMRRSRRTKRRGSGWTRLWTSCNS